MFFFDPITILSAVLPSVINGIDRLIGHFTGGPRPQTVQELVELKELDIRQYEALAQMEGSMEGVSPWVANLRALQRPLVTYGIIALFVGVVTYLSLTGGLEGNTLMSYLFDMASSVTFYLFGDRTSMYLSKRK